MVWIRRVTGSFSFTHFVPKHLGNVRKTFLKHNEHTRQILGKQFNTRIIIIRSLSHRSVIIKSVLITKI